MLAVRPEDRSVRVRAPVRACKDVIRRLCAAAFALALRLDGRRYGFPAGTALVIAPHADDETLGCGGLIAAKRRRGQDVRVVFVTDSSGSHPGHPLWSEATMAARRRDEALAACAELGVSGDFVTFLDFSDGTLERFTAAQGQEVVQELAELIRATAAVEVFAPYRGDGNGEHAAVCRLAEQACRDCGLGTLHEYPVWAWWNPFRLRFRLGRAGNLHLRLGDLRGLKRRALACHRSQFEPLPPAAEPAVPPILSRLCCGPTEFYFRTALR